MEINKELIKQLTESHGYDHLEELIRDEMKKMRDVLNIKGEDGRDHKTEVIARQEAYKMMERFFKRIGIIKHGLKRPTRTGIRK